MAEGGVRGGQPWTWRETRWMGMNERTGTGTGEEGVILRARGWEPTPQRKRKETKGGARTLRLPRAPPPNNNPRVGIGGIPSWVGSPPFFRTWYLST